MLLGQATAGSVSTSRVGASRSSAQRWQSRRGCRRSRPPGGRRRTRRSPRPSSARSQRRRALEGEHRQARGRELEQDRQVLVRLLLPAGGPHELEALGQPTHQEAAAIADAVGDPVDEMEAARAAAISGGKPNRLITPSTSRNRIGRSFRLFPRSFKGSGLGGRTMGNVVLIKRSRVGGRPSWQGNVATDQEALTARRPLSSMTLQLGILLALVCALATNVGFLLKHRGASRLRRSSGAARSQRGRALPLQVVRDRHVVAVGAWGSTLRHWRWRRSRSSRPSWPAGSSS